MSTSALLDRFVYRVNVKWPAYNADTFKALLDKVYPERNNALFAEMAGLSHRMGHKMSPRSVVLAARAFYTEGTLALTNFDGMPTKVLQSISMLVENESLIDRSSSLLKAASELKNELFKFGGQFRKPVTAEYYNAITEFEKLNVQLQEEYMTSIRSTGPINSQLERTLKSLSDIFGDIDRKIASTKDKVQKPARDE
jgi:hypothetical protein